MSLRRELIYNVPTLPLPYFYIYTCTVLILSEGIKKSGIYNLHLPKTELLQLSTTLAIKLVEIECIFKVKEVSQTTLPPAIL